MLNGSDLILSSTSAVLSFVIAFEAFRARKFSAVGYLLNYLVGFLLLGLSFAVVLPIDLGLNVHHALQLHYSVAAFPPRIVLQCIAIILIALAYAHTRWAKQLLLVLSAALVFLVVLVLLPQVAVPTSVDTLVHVADAAVLGYIVVHLLRSITDARLPPATGLVFVAFSLMLLGQVAYAVQGVHPLHVIMFSAKLFDLLGLLALVCAFFLLQRMSPRPGADEMTVADPLDE